MSNILVINSSAAGRDSVSRVLVADAVSKLLEINPHAKVTHRDLGENPPPHLGRFVDMTVEHLFGNVWSGEALSIRDRRLIVLGVLGALGDLDNITVHMRQALQRGDLTKEELDEVVVQITHYAGWPRGTVALRAAGKAAAEPTGRT
jgi:4-carboxymuconolactone decarboxylase